MLQKNVKSGLFWFGIAAEISRFLFRSSIFVNMILWIHLVDKHQQVPLIQRQYRENLRQNLLENLLQLSSSSIVVEFVSIFTFSLPHELLKQLVEFVCQSTKGSRKKFHIWFHICNINGFGVTVSIIFSKSNDIYFRSSAWTTAGETTSSSTCGVSEGNISAIPSVDGFGSAIDFCEGKQKYSAAVNSWIREFYFTAKERKDICDVSSISWPLSLMFSLIRVFIFGYLGPVSLLAALELGKLNSVICGVSAVSG